MTTAIHIDSVSKQYRLGMIGTGTISHDLNRWWHRIRGKEDPYRMVGSVNDRTQNKTDKKSQEPDYVWALHDINLEVEQGEILGIIGRNGAGKSTLLKLLSRVTAPTTGEIKTKGRIASLLEVGTGFHPELTGRENVYLNGAILGMKRREISAQLDEIVDFSGCAKYIDTPAKRYSSGMMVRLGFAVAAHLPCEIMIVDEVLAVGDAEFQRKCIGKMQSVGRDGRTILFVSHNMASVRSLCDSALLMNNGTTELRAATDDVVSAYLQASRQSQTESLQARTDRSGSGELRWTEAMFTDASGAVVEEVIAGDAVHIACRFHCTKDIDLSKVIFSAALTDAYGTFVAAFVSDELETRIDRSQSREGELIITIPSLWVRGGQYRLRMLASYEDTAANSFLDHVENCASLSVLDTKLHPDGRSTRPGSYALVPATILVR